MEFIYPEKPKKTHQLIVEKLLQGVFIPIGNIEYEMLLQYQPWYTSFFMDSFSIELMHKEEVFYCVNKHRGMSFTKDVLTVIAILMYEISKTGEDPVIAIQTMEFSIEKINQYISESVQFSKYADKNKVDTRFVNRLESIGLVRKTSGDRFSFTRAIDIFLAEYDDLAQQIRELDDN